MTSRATRRFSPTTLYWSGVTSRLTCLLATLARKVVFLEGLSIVLLWQSQCDLIFSYLARVGPRTSSWSQLPQKAITALASEEPWIWIFDALGFSFKVCFKTVKLNLPGRCSAGWTCWTDSEAQDVFGKGVYKKSRRAPYKFCFHVNKKRKLI